MASELATYNPIIPPQLSSKKLTTKEKHVNQPYKYIFNMTSKTTRKILKIGNKEFQSSAITLPKDWVRFNRLKKVDLYYAKLIVITPPDQNQYIEDKIREFLQTISYEIRR